MVYVSLGHSRRLALAAALILIGSLCGAAPARADLFSFWGCHPPAHSPEKSEDDGDDDDEPRLSFAPTEWQQRGTLFQWPGSDVQGGPKLDAPLVADRPDFTEASVTVGWGVSQVEMGYTYYNDRNAGTTTTRHTYPELLLRQGMIADWFELRLSWQAEQDLIESNVGHQQSITHDLTVGCKVGLTPQDHYLPETAFILEADLPTGSNPNLVLPAFDYLYTWEFNEQVSLSGGTKFAAAVDDDTNNVYTQVDQSFSLGIQWTEKLSTFTEWFALLPAGADTVGPEQYMDGGFKYLINNNLQLDIRAGVGLNRAADNMFAGAGVVVRR
ncbi:MAG: transporter [Planctomycetia bacterium]|nr:transporter [Planctomycetia bacterium]